MPQKSSTFEGFALKFPAGTAAGRLLALLMIFFAALPFPNIDPVIFSIGPFAVRWYALAYVAGLVFGMWHMKRLVLNPALWAGRKPSATAKQIDDLFIWALLGVVLGGRVGYVLFYAPGLVLADPLSILRAWEGGMSFHGGFLGVVVASYIFGRRNGIGLDRLLDLGAAATPVGLGLGRLANFINGELYGRVTDAPWGFVFPGGGELPRHPSQLYEFALEGVALFAIVNFAVHRFKILARPGLASGLYALIYGLSRIAVETVREPDAHIGYFNGFMTMGMILSLPLLAIGIWLLLRSRHST
jgi:phosphatidylglycerol---prolipoprotein diacylglyceryl transferase